MNTVLFIVGWLACSGVAFYTFVRFSLREFGTVSVGEALFFAVLSAMGPLSVGAVLLALCLTSSGILGRVLWRRK